MRGEDSSELLQELLQERLRELLQEARPGLVRQARRNEGAYQTAPFEIAQNRYTAVQSYLAQ